MKMNGWRLMEHAPKDGSLIVGYGPGDGEINGEYEPGYYFMRFSYGKWYCEPTDAYSVEAFPILWRPLPKLPYGIKKLEVAHGPHA